MKDSKIVSVFVVFIVFFMFTGVVKYLNGSANYFRHSGDGYGKPTKVIVENTTVLINNYNQVLVSGTNNGHNLSVTLKDDSSKLPVIDKKTDRSTIYRYASYYKGDYVYYTQSQGVLKDYR